MVIELTDAEVKKFEDWKLSFGELPDIGFTGGHFGLEVFFYQHWNCNNCKGMER